MALSTYTYHTAESYGCACNGYLKASLERRDAGEHPHIPLEEQIVNEEVGAWCKFCETFFPYSRQFNRELLRSRRND